MPLSTLSLSQSQVLHTEVYECTTSGWLSFMYAVQWSNVFIAPYFPPGYPDNGLTPAQSWTAWGYTSYVTRFRVDTVRTLSIGDGGLQVSDAQVTSGFSLTLSGPGKTTLNFDFDAASWAAQCAYYNSTVEPPAPVSPTSIPQVVPNFLNAVVGAYPYKASYGVTIPEYIDTDWIRVPVPLTTGDPVNDLTKVAVDQVNSFTLPGGANVRKLIGNKFYGFTGGGTSVDVQTDAVANQIAIDYGPTPGPTSTPYYLVGPDGDGYYYWKALNSGVQVEGSIGAPFGALCATPNVPVGSLVVRSTPQGSFPALPALSIPAGSSSTIVAQAPADTTNWGGYRYLKLLARITGLASSSPLPRMFLGIAPRSQADPTSINYDALVSSALAGSPTFGTFYELAPTVASSTGEKLTIDLACPIKGSGSWIDIAVAVTGTNEGYYEFNTVTPFDPLGIGVGPVIAYDTATGKPYIPSPPSAGPSVDFPIETAETVNWTGPPDPSAVNDKAVLMLIVDPSSVTVSGSAASITLSSFAFTEKENVLTVRCNAQENRPVSAYGQPPAGVDVNLATDGTMFSVERDGKTALAVQKDFYTESYYASRATTFDDLLTWLGYLGNGYTVTFEPLYSNYPASTTQMFALLPTPSQFGPAKFGPGGSVSIPIMARCTLYETLCPWSQSAPPMAGDSALSSDTAESFILCLSDYVGGALADIAVTVQSGTIAFVDTPAVPENHTLSELVATPTTDFGPTSLTTDANGVLKINAGAPGSMNLSTLTENIYSSPPTGGETAATFEQHLLSPQIDGYFLTFDQGQIQGAIEPSGTTTQVFVSVRSGQVPPQIYYPAPSGGTDTTTYASSGPYPFLARSSQSVVRFQIGPSFGEAVYSEPRNCLVGLTTG